MSTLVLISEVFNFYLIDIRNVFLSCCEKSYEYKNRSDIVNSKTVKAMFTCDVLKKKTLNV